MVQQCRLTLQNVIREQSGKRYKYREDSDYTPESELCGIPSGCVCVVNCSNGSGNNRTKDIQPKADTNDCTGRSSNGHVVLSHPSYSCCFINILMFWFSFHECSLIYEQNVNLTSLNRKL